MSVASLSGSDVLSQEEVSDRESTNEATLTAIGFRKRIDTSKIATPSIEMQVSAAHLIESSKYFETLLTGPFREEKESSILLEEVPVQPFKILMDVIHHRNKHVLKYLEAEILYQLCVLIDMYKMHEATVLWTNLWFQQLCDQIPQEKSASLQHWAFICYVLQEAEQFQAVTQILQRHFEEGADEYKVPLPPAFDGESSDTYPSSALIVT